MNRIVPTKRREEREGKGPWRATKAWNWERSGKAIGKGATSAAVEASGWKESWREVKTWHHVVRSESPKGSHQ